MYEKTLKQILREQINLLADWNKENIDKAGLTEQVRLNAETIDRLASTIGEYSGHVLD